MNTITNAIIMAAGKGERLRPLTLKTPKPLLLINGKPIIESIINSLIAKDINSIYIVIGYLKEQFYYLPEKYKQVKLIENPYYETFNNLSSLYVARDYICNSIILDGDQIINNINVLSKDFQKSSYCVTMCNSPTKEWLLDVENNHVVNCHRDGGIKGYQLYSVSKWTSLDGKKLKNLLEIEFNNNNTKCYWDDIALTLYPQLFDLGIIIIEKNDIVEIDTYNEYLEYNK